MQMHARYLPFYFKLNFKNILQKLFFTLDIKKQLCYYI